MADNKYYSSNLQEAMRIAQAEADKRTIVLSSSDLGKLITLANMALYRLEGEDRADAEALIARISALQ